MEAGRVVTGGMFDHQREWWELPNFIRGLVTGYSGGKTLMLAKRMVWLALTNAPHLCITVSPSYPQARTTIVDTLVELLAGKCAFESSRAKTAMSYEWLRTPPYTFTIRHESPTGTRVGRLLCMSGEKPAALKGPNVAAAGIDEPFLMPDEVFRQVLARVRHPQAARREINIAGTPEGVINWGYSLFEGDLRNSLDVGLVQAATTANLANPPQYAATLEAAYDDNAAAAYVRGEFVNLSAGRVYHAFDPTVAVHDLPEPEGAELGCGMDFNVDPMAFCVFWRQGARLHFVAEYELPNSDTGAAAAKLTEKHPRLRRIYPDASGQARATSSPHGASDFTVLQTAGFQITARPANPLRRDRYNAVNAALSGGQVTIAPQCRKLRTYLMAATHANANTAAQKAMGHLLDAFGYPIAYLLPAKKQTMRRTRFSGA